MPVDAVLLLVLAALLIITGLVGLVLPAMPGAPLLLAGLVVAAWAEDFAYVGMWTIGVLALLALATYVVDIVAGALGAKHFGASPRAMIGAVVGALVGLFFGLVGVLLGPFVGACLGELSMQRTVGEAGWAGFGATVGLVIGAALKIALAFSMLGVYAVVRFF